ncbi:TolC family protein [Chondrinema litorale]|uniref:TolC family protein n=1 Tax=Chondrinema litorale TaxID=2994555 RepID=UPI002543AA38|nr:TolC family protein [Chondrinema litorale]UZR98022.1 TolC family protein [Chondrinema litorale]
MKLIFKFIAVALCLMHFNLKAQLLPSEKVELDSLLEIALKNSHTLKEINEKLNQQRSQLKVEKLSWFSGIDVGLQFFSMEQQVDSENGQSFYASNVLPQVGGSLRISLHNLITTPQRIKIAKSDLIRTEEGIENTIDDIERWITMKYFELVSTKRQTAITKELLISQEHAFALVKQKFEKNEAKLDDFLKAQNAIQQTKETLIKHELSLEKFKAELSIITK